MKPDIWRDGIKVPVELKKMLDEIYAIDLVMARNFVLKNIDDEETCNYWDSNQKYSIESFYNGISHTEFPQYVIGISNEVMKCCDSIISSTTDKEVVRAVKYCNQAREIILHTIIRMWTNVYPVNAFGNKGNITYFKLSSWNSYDWTQCPAFIFAEYLSLLSQEEPRKTCARMFIDQLDGYIQSFFGECFPNKRFHMYLTKYGIYISFRDLLDVMTCKPFKKKTIKECIRYINPSESGWDRVASNVYTPGCIEAIYSPQLFRLIQKGCINAITKMS